MRPSSNRHTVPSRTSPVDLSAWFDEPPDILLQRVIWYLDNDKSTDNTLGGLLPEVGFTAVVEVRSEAMPASFALVQNYPTSLTAAR